MMSDVAPRSVTIAELLASYEGVLLDAYGVLVDAAGVLPGATELIGALAHRGIRFAVVTNDASRSQATYVRKLAGLGLPIAADHILTSGSLLPAYFASRGLVGARTLVLGTDDSRAYVVAGGGIPITLAAGMEIDAVAICDDAGTPFLDGIELALSAIIRAVETGRRPALVLPNPDLVYPKGGGELGFTAGAMGLLVEAALARRFPDHGLVFDRLGKPAPDLFRAGKQRLGVERVVMIGDQLETDIAGARAAGIDCALLAGISRWDAGSATGAAIVPTYLLADLAL